jgi:chemotaxis protein CheD
MCIEVKMGKIAAAKDTETLTASGVGSCVIITLYEHKLKIGAMAHTMLPARCAPNPIGNRQYDIRDAKYSDIAIEEMLKKLETQGAKSEDLEAKIIGGANMFPDFKSDISGDNVSSVKKKLKRKGIRIVGESVGGSQGRSVEFFVASGIVKVKIIF